MKKGGWWEPSYSYGVKSFVLRTPSRKFELYSQVFEEKIRNSLKNMGEEEDKNEKNLEKLGIGAEGDNVFMPHYEVPEFKGDVKEYPLYLYVYKPLNFSKEYQANQPWFHEIMGFHLDMTWDSWAEVNPHTAEELGIEEDDLIWVESVYGKVRVIAKIYPGAMPEEVCIPYGLGHEILGRWAQNRGINPIELIGANFDELTGLPVKFSVRVKIYKG